MKQQAFYILTLSLGLGLLACDESATPNNQGGTLGGGTAADGDSPRADDIPDDVPTLDVPVQADVRSYVDLKNLRSVDASQADSTAWDLAFQGYEVFTNSGPSGPGQGAAFGPFDSAYFFVDKLPEGAPPLTPDTTGGAFLDWYRYDGSTHALYSRFHVHAVRAGDRQWKVQVLGYYGERNGGPVSALYSLRYAELIDGAFGETKTVQLDGTAGGPTAPAHEPSGCIDLRDGSPHELTVEQTRSNTEWVLCARRDRISVNGGISGPLGASAADLHEGESASETVDVVSKRSAESELPRFDAVGAADLANATLRTDGVVTAFRSLWIDKTHTPPQSGTGSWVVRGADGASTYLAVFPEFTGATAQSPNQVTLAVKKAE